MVHNQNSIVHRYAIINPYWHLLDQVLISPDLINNYVKDSFEIITTFGLTNLLKQSNKRQGTKMKRNILDKQFSDHLPITFQLKI